jgi:sugar/nucleoside kinase (ribokinase family)
VKRRSTELKTVNPELKPEPLVIWEPVPDVCTPEGLETCYEALKLVNVVSPNHQELAAFFGLSGSRGEDVDSEVIERCAADWLAHGSESGLNVVVRAGKDGCYMASRNASKWMPAYHQLGSGKVVDPTGGGNTFLGGLAVGLARGKRLEEAAIWGSVAASFAIEQVGMPTLTYHTEGERWNGEVVEDRFESFRRRLE